MSDGKGPLIIAVAGRHNVGKTTVGTRMVEAWTEMGLLVATLKHDGHADVRQLDKTSDGTETFESPAVSAATDDWEKPGSDTERLVKAGATMTMIVGGGQTLLRTTRDTESNDVHKLLFRLQQHARTIGPDLDVILVEGYKYSDLPKVVVIGPDDREWLFKEAFTSVQAVVESPLWSWRESQRLGKTVSLTDFQAKTSNASFTQKHLPVYHGNNLRDLCRSLWYTHIPESSL